MEVFLTQGWFMSLHSESLIEKNAKGSSRADRLRLVSIFFFLHSQE